MIVKGLVVCVNYDDLLTITLPRNARHLSEIVVVTTPDDVRTQQVVKETPSARCITTDLFTRNGAAFNKGAAIEHGFDALGRDGWILVWDADTLLPDSLPVGDLDPKKLYGAPRRLLDDVSLWHPEFVKWKKLPLSSEAGWPGYFHLFNAACPRLRDRPWYDVSYRHAGGGDGFFQSRWPTHEKAWLPCEVLHLGPRDVNWFGRVSPRTDGQDVNEADERAAEMEQLLSAHGWAGRKRQKEEGFTERIHSSVEK